MKTLNDFERGYVIGMLDAQGHIMIIPQVRGVRRAVSVFLTFNDGNKLNRDRLRKILQSGGCSVESRKRDRKKSVYKLNVCSQMDLARILPQLIPAMSLHRARAELLLEYVSSRLSHDNKRTPITAEEWKIVENFCKLKETTPCA